MLSAPTITTCSQSQCVVGAQVFLSSSFTVEPPRTHETVPTCTLYARPLHDFLFVPLLGGRGVQVDGVVSGTAGPQYEGDW